MVIRIDCADRRVLLCGDIQREAIEELLASHDASSLRADISELPHHGSYIAAADQFMRLVRPAVVMQSTGWQRWRRDEWVPALATTDRLVTARDGAGRVSIDHNGKIEVARHIEQAIATTMAAKEH
jgi:beta-lactamase superfamily II metal-dependent hydrolase